MQRALTVTALIWLCCAACATVERLSTDTRLIEAKKAFEEGQRLKEAGKYVEAELCVELALDLRESALGGAHPEVASCLLLLGEVHWRQGLYARAEPLLERALAIREAALGQHHPLVAEALNHLANLSYSQGLYARAEALYPACSRSGTAPSARSAPTSPLG